MRARPGPLLKARFAGPAPLFKLRQTGCTAAINATSAGVGARRRWQQGSGMRPKASTRPRWFSAISSTRAATAPSPKGSRRSAAARAVLSARAVVGEVLGVEEADGERETHAELEVGTERDQAAREGE